jgi:L-cystine uptake protein TcyP (sodium:dicarboxylate symporter family)
MLLSMNSKPNDLTSIIVEVINEEKPRSVMQLVRMLRQNLDLAEEDIIKHVMKLQADGVIRLENQAVPSNTFATYLKTGEAIWYWVIIITGLMTVVTVFTLAENMYPWIYARNVLGIVFVLFMPGYSFVKAFFPTNVFDKTSISGSLETIIQVALSIGMSIALVSMVGLLLYFSPYSLDLTSAVPSLLALTLVFATAGAVKEYRTKRKDLDWNLET